MRSLRLLLFAIPVFAAFLPGCTVTKTVETTILDTKLNGPVTEIPIHVTTPGTPRSFTVTPHLSVGPGKTMFGSVEGSSGSRYSPGYPPSSAYNLKWDLPPSVFGIDIDYAAEASAFSLGANYSSSGSSSRWGLLASFGTFSVSESKIGLRLDLGCSLQGISQRTASVVVTTDETWFLGYHSVSVDTAYYLDSFTENRFGFFAAVTLNTTSQDAPANLLFQAAFHRQTLFSFEPRTRIQQDWLAPMPLVIETRSSGGEATTASSFISIAPALSVDLASNTRVVAGARMLWPVSDNVKTPKSIIIPFLRFDIIFN